MKRYENFETDSLDTPDVRLDALTLFPRRTLADPPPPRRVLNARGRVGLRTQRPHFCASLRPHQILTLCTTTTSPDRALLWRGVDALALDAAAGSEPWTTPTRTAAIAALQRAGATPRFAHPPRLGRAPADRARALVRRGPRRRAPYLSRT